MLDYNQITQRKYIVLNDEPYEVITSQVSRKQANKPTNQTKLKSLINGKVIQKNFHSSEKVLEAEIETKKIKYLYNSNGEYWFSEEDNPRQRFKLNKNVVGENIKFVKENSLVDSLFFRDAVIGIKIPIKVTLLVKEASPAVKGNTAQGANKQIILETDTVINAPLFVKEGDFVRVNTETGEYVERV